MDWENDTERYFDHQNPNTRFVLALGDTGAVLGGGRILHKRPGDDFCLDFQQGDARVNPFQQKFHAVLETSGLSERDLNVFEIGGLVAVPYSRAGLRVMQRMGEIVRNESNYITVSRIDKQNAVAALRAIRDLGVHATVVPELKMGDTEVVMALSSNHEAVGRAFEALRDGRTVCSLHDYLEPVKTPYADTIAEAGHRVAAAAR